MNKKPGDASDLSNDAKRSSETSTSLGPMRKKGKGGVGGKDEVSMVKKV